MARPRAADDSADAFVKSILWVGGRCRYNDLRGPNREGTLDLADAYAWGLDSAAWELGRDMYNRAV